MDFINMSVEEWVITVSIMAGILIVALITDKIGKWNEGE